jgi:hypothetical protein
MVKNSLREAQKARRVGFASFVLEQAMGFLTKRTQFPFDKNFSARPGSTLPFVPSACSALVDLERLRRYGE